MRRPRRLHPALGLALLVGACTPEPAASLPVRGAVPGVSVLTYNVNFEREGAAMLAAIASTRPDVAFLQEVTPTFEAALRARFADAYPTLLVRPALDEGGMAVLSRFPVEEVAWLDSPVGRFPAWCGRVSTPLGALDVLHVHLHPPLDENGLFTGYFTTGEVRRTEIAAHLRCFGDPPDVVLGDLNEEYGLAVSLVEAAGLRDAASRFPPPRRTWSWPVGPTELEGRPDHVFVGPRWQAREVTVLEAGGSDHRPLRVVLGRAR